MAAGKNHNDPGFELTVSNLKKALANTVGHDLIKEGFTLDSKLTTLRKKNNSKNQIRISFDCYDYKPARLEFRLLFVFILKEIDYEAEKFFAFCGEKYNPGWTIILGEGDFHPKVRHLEPKYRNAATHIITDEDSLNEGITDCREVLRNEIIPQLSKFSTLETFQDFILNDYDSMARLHLFIQSLIAAKLKNKEALVKLVDHLWVTLALGLLPDDHITKKLVTNIIPYSDID